MGPRPGVPFLRAGQRLWGIERSASIHNLKRSKGFNASLPFAIRFRKVTPFLATVQVQQPNLAFPQGAPFTSRTVGHSSEALAYRSATSLTRSARGRSTRRLAFQ